MSEAYSLRHEASRFEGDFAFVSSLTLEDARRHHTVASTAASSGLQKVIVGTVLARDQDVKHLLTKFRPWLHEGLSRGESSLKRNGSPADDARWNEALALYDWLMYGQQNAQALDHAIDHWFGWYATSEGQKYRGEIGSLFALAIDARRYREIIELYARPLATRKPTSATSEAGFGNFLAHRLLHEQRLDPDAEEAFDRFLWANMHEKWLSHGHYKTAAHWLKLRFWNFADPKPEPFTVVRRALDYLPEEARQ